jgi:hypothetical protein
VADRNDPVPRRGDRTDGDDFSLAQIARAGVMVFGFVITLIGILLLVSLFSAVYGMAFNDADGFKEVFEKWREIIVPEGVEPGHYDDAFPVTTVLAFTAMALPVLFLGWLATRVLTIGIKVASLKDKKHNL